MTAGPHVTRWGKGEPIVCVHGSFGWGEETFQKQRELADAYELLLIDRRGYGVVHGTWDVAPPSAREISATALHAISDVLVGRLGAESAVFSGAMHNPQLLGAPFNDRLRELLRPARPRAVGNRDAPKAAR